MLVLTVYPHNQNIKQITQLQQQR